MPTTDAGVFQKQALTAIALIAGSAGDTGLDDAVADGIQLFMGSFLQTHGGSIAVDGIDHYLLGTDGLDGFKPGRDVLVARIVYRFFAVCLSDLPSHEHGLDDDVSVERFHVFDETGDVVVATGTVYLIDI